MTEAEKLEATALLAANQKSLDQLFDYTKFHIQIYITFTSAFVGAVKGSLVGANSLIATGAVVAIMIAGLAGGVIASSITQTVGGSSKDFLQSQIGPFHYDRLRLSGRTWTYIEHASFWIGLLLAGLSIVITKGAGSSPDSILLWGHLL